MIELLPLLEDQIRSLGRLRPTLIFPEGEDPRVIEGSSRLTGVANVVLVGSRANAERLIDSGEVDIKGSRRRFFHHVKFVIPEEEEELREEFFQMFWRMSSGRRWAVTEEKARDFMKGPVMFACMAVRCGYADSVLGGLVHTSGDFFRPALRLLHTDRRAFEVGLFSLPDEHPSQIYQKNLVAFADVAINADPDAETLAEIAVGACKIVRDLVPTSVLPHINGAILSYSTRGSGQGASVERTRKAGALLPGMLAKLAETDPLYGTIRIEPELQMSCAISLSAAESKLHDAVNDPGSAVGRANVLIVPSLDTGNVLYHLYATRYPGGDRVLMVGGMDARVLDFSRSATSQDLVLGAMANVLRLKRRADWDLTPQDHFFRRFRLLVINPSTNTTCVSAYQGHRLLHKSEVSHDPAALSASDTVFGQLETRLADTRAHLEKVGVDVREMDAIVGRGGLLRPVPSGTYEVNEAMLADLEAAVAGEHPSNLGPVLAESLARPLGIKAYTVDPVVVDELDDVARVTGVAGHQRRAVWHSLSQKAVAKRYADRELTDYENLNLIVAHTGLGVSIGAHRKGECVYVNDALEEGPITPERAGYQPLSALLELGRTTGWDEREMRRQLVGNGGLVSHLGTNDIQEVERRIDAGDEDAAKVWEAMAQSVAARIAGTIVRFRGEPVDQIILTGLLTDSGRFVERLKVLLNTLPIGITVYAGERECDALRDGALRVMRGLERPGVYGA